MVIMLGSNCICLWARTRLTPDLGPLEYVGIWRNLSSHCHRPGPSYPLTKDENRFLYPWRGSVISVIAVMLIAIQHITIFPLLARVSAGRFIWLRHEHRKTFVSRLLGRYKDREARECTVLLPDKHSLLLRVTIDLNVLSQDCFVQFPLKEKSAPAPDSTWLLNSYIYGRK